jgi:hypothetical protein
MAAKIKYCGRCLAEGRVWVQPTALRYYLGIFGGVGYRFRLEVYIQITNSKGKYKALG